MVRWYKSPAFTVSVAILLMAGVAAFWTISHLNNAQKRVNHTFEVIDKLNHVRIGMIDAETGKRGFLITGLDEFLDPYRAALQFIDPDIQDLRRLTRDNSAQQKRIDLLVSLVNQQLAWMQQRIATRRREGFGAVSKASDLRYGKAMMDRLRHQIDELEMEERRLLEERNDHLARLGDRIRFLVLFGSLISILLIGRSITLLEREIEIRRQAEMRMDAVNKELEAFSYTVSHDLRAPLRHIAGFSDLLQDDPTSHLSDTGRHYVDTVIKAVKRMGRLVDDLLAFSRVGRISMQTTTVDLTRMVQDIVQELEGETTGRQVEWKLDPLKEVHGDPVLLRQAFVNLLSNALKYTRPRAIAVIHVGIQSQNDRETTFFVRDNGVGFDMQFVDKLFGVFQRLHSAAEFEGTGIGLAFVQRIIHRHGGRIWAEGAVNQGATFFFTLPNS